jgi:hypothetical protein
MSNLLSLSFKPLSTLDYSMWGQSLYIKIILSNPHLVFVLQPLTEIALYLYSMGEKQVAVSIKIQDCGNQIFSSRVVFGTCNRNFTQYRRLRYWNSKVNSKTV